jgi:hypothetical protein
MAEKTVSTKPAERTYILPPHPEARTVTNAKTIVPEEPTVAGETLSEMVEQAVAGLRGELKAEIQSELHISRGGGTNVEG